jgi:hypothetical protein
VAYKQKLCMTCAATNLVPLVVASDDNLLACPCCHIDTEDIMDPVFVTYILPGSGKEQGEFATCGPCAVEVRNKAMQGAEQLEDRQVGVGAAAPTLTPVAGWDALGLRRLREP